MRFIWFADSNSACTFGCACVFWCNRLYFAVFGVNVLYPVCGGGWGGVWHLVTPSGSRTSNLIFSYFPASLRLPIFQLTFSHTILFFSACVSAFTLQPSVIDCWCDWLLAFSVMAFPASQLLCAATGRLNCQMAAIDGQIDRNRLVTAMSQCVLITSERPIPVPTVRIQMDAQCACFGVLSNN